ncbi:putative nuclear transport factor 2 [Glonium stellatum]|uniref:Nuclear transport factor 2 n=1 Tax=Glonium stellatum TaxID=574774 RepID=A0A8E2JPC6_9PEZI|nr:putative nuclear transport factor 2 [Glonium stellatum]
MADFNTIAQQFVEFYYNTFDTSRQNLSALYREHSMLTFENAPVQGTVAISDKLLNLPFAQVKHKVDTLDAQPSSEDGGILVLVTGALLVEGSDRPMSYTQAFQLRPEAGSYYVFNDVFRLVYPAA